MEQEKLLPHLFRSEYGKIVSVLCKNFGLHNIQLAQDLTSDTFLKASETWGLKGVPENPKAWLYHVAKNKTKDHFRREKILKEKVIPALENRMEISSDLEIDLSSQNITDSQLQMLFSVCHPSIAVEAQIALALRVLCGFGIDEISKALLAKPAAIKKRLLRAKETLRTENISLTLPKTKELNERLNKVLSILYLLFNEGYYSTSSDRTIRKDLCLESMRLLYLLLEKEAFNSSATNALMALFCFHSSRFEARENELGEQILYANQDQSLWNDELINKGERFLQAATSFQEISKYYLEASIAYWHTRKEVDENNKWKNILQLYNQLIQLKYSPVTALNRTYALSKVYGNKKAIHEAMKIDLKDNHLYHALLAELYQGQNRTKQIEHLGLAIQLAQTKNDRVVLEKKMNDLK